MLAGTMNAGTKMAASAPAAPAVAPPALPVPTDAQLDKLATAHPEFAFPRGGDLSLAHNAHYTNSRAQLGYALDHPYNELEGDVRFRGGTAVMAHDSGADNGMTFEHWARLGAQAGRMLRVDIKEAKALPSIEATLAKLQVPDDRVSFNLSVDAPWMKSNFAVDAVRALRERHPDAWITFNTPLPERAGYAVVGRVARQVGGPRLGVALQGQFVTVRDVAWLKAHNLTVNVWNYPPLWEPTDVEATTAAYRAMGVNGQIDLRRRDDPLAND